jgi:protein required for attachment to host cells
MNAQSKTSWILVADRARARLFEWAGRDAKLVEIETFVNPDGRGPERNQTTDRPSRVHESMGATRHAIEPHTSLRDKSADQFARELDASLERGRTLHRYEHLVLVAPPQFLGVLRAALGKHVREHVAAEVPHELTTKGPEEILAHLPKKIGG